jgi:GNAT superfamily N-acetyltransferase
MRPASILPRYRIVHARQHDLPLLPAIELAAARMLTGHAPAAVLGETTTQFEHRAAWRHRRLWVALADDVPVGFAHVVVREPGVAHLEELDVHPEHGRRGLGRSLVSALCAWAAEQRYGAVTLTTFRDVPWNMPFYESVGFVVVPPDEISSALLSVVIDEYRRGLDPHRRVVMRYTTASHASHASSPAPDRATQR